MKPRLSFPVGILVYHLFGLACVIHGLKTHGWVGFELQTQMHAGAVWGPQEIVGTEGSRRVPVLSKGQLLFGPSPLWRFKNMGPVPL